MNTRLMLVCLLGFAGGVAAVPLSMTMARSVSTHPAYIPTTAVSKRSTSPLDTPRRMPTDLMIKRRVSDGQPNRFVTGSVPATLTITDSHCMSFSISGPEAAQVQQVTPDDSRFQPCKPSINSFFFKWSVHPTPAQAAALSRVLADLAANHPAITLAEADPIIHAAVDNAQ